MFDTLKTVLLVVLFIYSIIISVLFWIDKNNLENYQKDRLSLIVAKEKELEKRESIVVDKEICFRELTKLKTVQSTALDVLKSYTITSPEQQKQDLVSTGSTSFAESS